MNLLLLSALADTHRPQPCTPAELHQRPTAIARAAVEPLLAGETLRRYLEALETRDAGEPKDLAAAIVEALNYTCPSCEAIVDPDPEGCIAMSCAHCRSM